MTEHLEIIAAVFSNGSHLLVVPLDDRSEMPHLVHAARGRGYSYCGVMSCSDGHACAKCVDDPEARLVMAQATTLFAQYVAERIKAWRKPVPKWAN